MMELSEMSTLRTNRTALCPLNEDYKHILLPLAYSVVFLLGLGLNASVLWLSCCRTKEWTCSTIYLVNLAVADLLHVCSLPLLILNYAMRDKWPFGTHVCKLVRFLFYANLYGSILFLTCVSVHRFLGVCYPIRSINYRTRKFAVIGTTITWILVIIELLPTLIFAHTGTVNNQTVCYDLTSPDKFSSYFAYGMMLTVSGFLVPFCIILLCCCLMIKSLIQSNESCIVGTPLRTKAIRTVLLVFALFAVSFVPFHITRTVYLIVRVYFTGNCPLLQGVSVSYKIWRPLVSFNSCINPLLYFLTGNKNRIRFMNELRNNKVSPPP
ncbi:P2Y purinoceptor 3-like [Ambystoma mexicanum]|uniref:P2Y purinoceptor 3-like n=1 Tax=Ambystoma mexicanum TaxID=8296 RepID=UPI0037E7BC8C